MFTFHPYFTNNVARDKDKRWAISKLKDKNNQVQI